MEGWVLKHCCCNPETRTSTQPTHIHTFTHKHTHTMPVALNPDSQNLHQNIQQKSRGQ